MLYFIGSTNQINNIFQLMKQNEFPLIKTRKVKNNLIYTKRQTKSQFSPKRDFESRNYSRNAYTYNKLSSSQQSKSKQQQQQLSHDSWNKNLLQKKQYEGKQQESPYDSWNRDLQCMTKKEKKLKMQEQQLESQIAEYQKERDIQSEKLTNQRRELKKLKGQMLIIENKLKQEMSLEESNNLELQKIIIESQIQLRSMRVQDFSYNVAMLDKLVKDKLLALNKLRAYMGQQSIMKIDRYWPYDKTGYN